MTPPRHRAMLKDLAAAVGVAHPTLPNADNVPDQLPAELRLRILAAADTVGHGGSDPAARDVGIAVPDALSGAGFDDTLAESSIPALATVRQPHLLTGRAAARALLAQLRGEPPVPFRLLPKLVVLGSSGPASEEQG